MLKRTTKPLRRRVLIEDGPAKSSRKQHSENTDKWHLCKAGSFSYGESPRTPPLEGTSLHRWNKSVERPWGILSLFTTCLCLSVKSPCHRLWHVRRRVLIEENLAKKHQRKHSELKELVKQVVFHTVNHCGPLPLKELHSTGETIVWRDPGGSWACLPPVYVCLWNHPATGCDM